MWCDCNFSIEDEFYNIDNKENSKDQKVRGNIVLSGNLVEDNEDGQSCTVRSYNEMNMKLNLP
jgi:hypothetical protein